MIDSSLASVLITGGGAVGAVLGVICILFIIGAIFPKPVVDDLKKERDAERARADAAENRADAERQRADVERQRADTSIAASQATRDIMAALQAGLAMSQQAAPPAISTPPAHPGRSSRR